MKLNPALACCLALLFNGALSAADDDPTRRTPPPDGLRQNTPRVAAVTRVRVVPEPGRSIDDATVVIRDGRIERVEPRGVPPADAVVFDRAGLTLYAGFIDAYAELPPELSKADAAIAEGRGAKYWNAQIVPQVSASRLIKPDPKANEAWRAQGVVARYVAPSFGIIKGTGSMVSIGDADTATSLVSSDAALHVAVDHGAGEDIGYPTSPMGAFALVRQALYDAQWYASARAALTQDPSLGPVETNDALAALSASAAADRPLMIDAPDELYALRTAALAGEFNRRFIIRSGGFDYRVIEPLRAIGAPLIVPLKLPKPPDVTSPERARSMTLDKLMHWDLAPENAWRLRRAGLDIAFSSHGLKEPSEFSKSLATVVARGLPADEALRALTLAPARMLGVDSQLGSVTPGKRASFVIVEGDLFDQDATVVETWVDGQRFEIRNPRRHDVHGAWKLTTGGQEFTLSVDADDLTGTLAAVQNGIRLAPLKLGHVEVTAGRITFWAPSGSLSQSGVSLASVEIRDGVLAGRVTLPDGRTEVVTGTRISTEASTQPTTTPTTAPVTRPTAAATQDTAAAATTVAATAPVTRPATTPAARPTTRASFEPNWPLGAYGRSGLPAAPSTAVIHNATVWTAGDAGTIERATVVVQGGKIASVSTTRPTTMPADAVVVDAAGRHLTPGLIDCHSHIATDGGINESGQSVTCEVRIGDFVDPTDINIYRQLAAGVTSANILHGSANAIGGQNQVIKLRWGALPDQLKFEGAPPGVKFALGENPKQSNWGDKHTTRYPQTRMGVEQIMLDSFHAAADYERRWADWTASRTGLPPRRDLELEALVEIIRNRRQVHCHSYRQDEILALMRTAERIGFRVDVFQHILEGYKVAPEMKQHGAMASTFSDWWAYKFEVYDAIPHNGALMHRNGLVVSFNSDDPELARRLNTEAAKATKYGGVSRAEAIKFVTLNPAIQLGVADRVGSIEVGKDADLVLWTGDPLSPGSRVDQTWIDGRRYFDRAADQAAREETELMRRTLIGKVLGSGEKPAAPGEFPERPGALLPRDDLFCGHADEVAR